MCGELASAELNCVSFFSMALVGRCSGVLLLRAVQNEPSKPTE